jgi:predicted phosphodiesterase
VSADLVDGSFIDLGTKVNNGRFSTVKPEAFVLGDLHSGETCPITMGAWQHLSKKLKPESWVIHDGYDSKSANHHTDGKYISRAKVAMAGAMDLEKELDGFVADILAMTEHRKVVMVKSNHDEHLDRYLNEARYVTEPLNHKIALELAYQFVDGKNPLEYYFNKKVKKTKHPVIWLSRDESYKVAGIELGAHGDLGANGARGSVQTLEQAYGSCVVGHSHTPQIYRNVWVVGTSSFLQLDYNRGASSWFNTSCLVYPNGQRQMINSIDGLFTTRKL